VPPTRGGGNRGRTQAEEEEVEKKIDGEHKQRRRWWFNVLVKVIPWVPPHPSAEAPVRAIIIIIVQQFD
jgi:hypothetical protein